MGQRCSKNNYQPLIQLIFSNRKSNLYSIPENYNDFEAIAYNFYYMCSETLSPFEYINLTMISKGFLRQTLIIRNKSSYQKALKEIGRGTITITLCIEQYHTFRNNWLLGLNFQETNNEAIDNKIEKLIECINENQSDLVDLFENYITLLKISNQFSLHITTHEIKSCIFGIVMVVASDPCNKPLPERFKIIEKLPYIEFKPEDMSENALDVIRIWNDFIFYLPKCLNEIEMIINLLVSIENLAKQAASAERSSHNKHVKNRELVVKSIEAIIVTRDRVKNIEESIRDYSVHLQKPDTLDQMMKISSIISSCGGYGLDNLMSIFSISTVNKYPSN